MEWPLHTLEHLEAVIIMEAAVNKGGQKGDSPQTSGVNEVEGQKKALTKDGGG